MTVHPSAHDLHHALTCKLTYCTGFACNVWRMGPLCAATLLGLPAVMQKVCVCVCVREREREEKVRVRVCVCLYMHVGIPCAYMGSLVYR